MDKKVLKFYEAPAAEVVELKLEGFLCASGDIEGVGNKEDLTGGNDELFN